MPAPSETSELFLDKKRQFGQALSCTSTISVEKRNALKFRPFEIMTSPRTEQYFKASNVQASGLRSEG